MPLKGHYALFIRQRNMIIIPAHQSQMLDLRHSDFILTRAIAIPLAALFSVVLPSTTPILVPLRYLLMAPLTAHTLEVLTNTLTALNLPLQQQLRRTGFIPTEAITTPLAARLLIVVISTTPTAFTQVPLRHLTMAPLLVLLQGLRYTGHIRTATSSHDSNIKLYLFLISLDHILTDVYALTIII
jgi:hypothetical protein